MDQDQGDDKSGGIGGTQEKGGEKLKRGKREVVRERENRASWGESWGKENFHQGNFGKKAKVFSACEKKKHDSRGGRGG